MTQISASAPAAHLDVGQGSLRLGQGWVLGRLYGNSRGMSAPGPNRKYSLRADDVRSTPESGLKSDIRPCPKSAKKRHPVVSRSVECESAWGPIADRPISDRSISFLWGQCSALCHSIANVTTSRRSEIEL